MSIQSGGQTDYGRSSNSAGCIHVFSEMSNKHAMDTRSPIVWTTEVVRTSLLQDSQSNSMHWKRTKVSVPAHVYTYTTTYITLCTLHLHYNLRMLKWAKCKGGSFVLVLCQCCNELTLMYLAGIRMSVRNMTQLGKLIPIG